MFSASRPKTERVEIVLNVATHALAFAAARVYHKSREVT
jgi:hypothetical protein